MTAISTRSLVIFPFITILRISFALAHTRFLNRGCKLLYAKSDNLKNFAARWNCFCQDFRLRLNLASLEYVNIRNSIFPLTKSLLSLLLFVLLLLLLRSSALSRCSVETRVKKGGWHAYKKFFKMICWKQIEEMSSYALWMCECVCDSKSVIAALGSRWMWIAWAKMET